MAEENRSHMGEQVVWREIPDIVEPIYKIDEKPEKWYECILYGWQHTLVDVTPLVLPVILGAAIGMNASQQASFVNFCLFAMGVATILQTTIGNRLPIIQGPSAALTATLKSVGAAFGAPAMWGAVLVGSIVEMAIGLSKILQYLRKLFPITVCGIVVVSIGISLGQVGIDKMIMFKGPRLMNFALAAGVILLIMLLQVGFAQRLGGILSRGAIFFSIWIVGLGVSGLLGEVNWAVVADKDCFALPKLFPYGTINSWQFAAGAIVGVFVGFLGSIMESIGDYAAVCAVSGEPYKVEYMNRGIFCEGLGCMLASLFGGIPCTSYTQNIGVIATTRVASRFVVQIAAVILMLYGLCPKFGALLIAMPRAVVGGVFVVVCGMIVVSGLKLLSACKTTPANSLLIGITLIVAIGLPNYAAKAPQFAILPRWTKLLLENTVVLAVMLGISLNLLLNIILPTFLVKKREE